MKFFRVPVATLAVAIFAAVLSFPASMCGAQSATADADARTTAPVTAESRAIIERYMISVDIELTSKLDSRNAAVGQQVTAKTLDPAKLADGTALPPGTRLIGHVALVQAQTQDQPYARLAISFDRAELKNGQNVALRSEIRMVAPPANAAAVASDSMMSGQPMGPLGGATSTGGGMGAGGTGGVGSSSTRGGTGLGGGVPAGPGRPPLGPTTASVGQTAGTTLGDATDPSSLAEAAAGAPGGVVAQAGETVSAVPRATALPGVMISTSGAADASGTLMAAGRNISLDTGTHITLGLITR